MADQLVITSPGGFIAGITPENILRHEPVSRNRTLAEAFEKLRLVERAGIGRRRIFETMLAYGKKIPEYEADGRVTLRIFDGSFDERTAALVARWRGEGREIGLDGLLILSFLRDHAFIDTLSAAKLLQLSPGGGPRRAGPAGPAGDRLPGEEGRNEGGDLPPHQGSGQGPARQGGVYEDPGAESDSVRCHGAGIRNRPRLDHAAGVPGAAGIG